MSSDDDWTIHPTIYLQERYMVRCACGWTTYPYLSEEGAVTEWREHQQTAHIDGPDPVEEEEEAIVRAFLGLPPGAALTDGADRG